MKNIDILEIAEMSRKVDRWTLSDKLNDLIKEQTGIKEFLNPDNMVFNRFHMCVLIELLKLQSAGEKR